jgi:hypothetical protein
MRFATSIGPDEEAVDEDRLEHEDDDIHAKD